MRRFADPLRSSAMGGTVTVIARAASLTHCPKPWGREGVVLT